MILSDELQFHHIGYCCKSIASEEKQFALLGYQREGEIFADPAQKIRGLFICHSGFRLELLEATTEDSPVHAYLAKNIKMYHHAFIAKKFDDVVESLHRDGCKMVVPPTKAVAFNGRKICFFVQRNLQLLELIEANGS